MRSTIGITASFDDEKGIATCPKAYTDSVLEAGGKPLLIPIMPDDVAEEMLSVVDGLLFPGGVDIDPFRYGERPHAQLGRIDPTLDALELGLAQKALAMNVPMLGICRGCQLISVAAGGGLVQDIPSQIGGALKHKQLAPRWHGTHEVILDEDSLAARIFGTRRLTANSFHHQSVKNPGDTFVVSGRAVDGVVEALESRKGFRLLIQWHPEAMWGRNSMFLKPFKALCLAAAGKDPV